MEIRMGSVSIRLLATVDALGSQIVEREETKYRALGPGDVIW
jgi:hypothetical protein